MMSALLSAVAVPAAAGDTPTITLTRFGERTAPADGLLDLLPDGRALVLQSDHRILRETAPASGVFDEVGRIADGIISTFGASFFSVSPDGSYLAFGDNNFGSGRVYVSLTAWLDGRTLPLLGIDQENFTAAWLSPTELAVGAGDPLTGLGQVSIITIGLPLRSTLVLENVGGASGSVGFDAHGNLYTGNGFDFTPGMGSSTGDVRGFDAVDVQRVLQGGRDPLQFEDEGRSIVRRLSAGGLDFDPAGNLFVGGGDLFGGSGDFNYFAVLNGDAVQDIMTNEEPGPVGDADIFIDDPSQASAQSTYTAWFDRATGEWLMESADNPGTLYRYRVTRRISNLAGEVPGREAVLRP